MEIPRQERRSDNYAIITARSWTFLLRVTSGRQPLCRRRAGWDLRSGYRLEKKAVIGLVGGKLATKLR